MALEIGLTVIFSMDYMLHYYLAEDKVRQCPNPLPILVLFRLAWSKLPLAHPPAVGVFLQLLPDDRLFVHRSVCN